MPETMEMAPQGMRNIQNFVCSYNCGCYKIIFRRKGDFIELPGLKPGQLIRPTSGTIPHIMPMLC